MFASQVVVFDVPDMPEFRPWVYLPAAVVAWYFLSAVVMRLVLPKSVVGTGYAVAVWFGLPVRAVVLAVWSALWVFTVGLVAPPWRVMRDQDYAEEVLAVSCCIASVIGLTFCGVITYHFEFGGR